MEMSENIVYLESNMNFIDTSEVIKGYDFNKSNNILELVDSYKTTGIQADNLHKAVEIIDKMLDSKNDIPEKQCHVYLGVSSSVIQQSRSAIKYLCEHKLVNVVVTTAAGIEEDIY